MSQVSSHLMAHKTNPIQNPYVLKSSYLLSYLIGYRLGLGDVYQLASDDVYNETSWWTMTSGRWG